MSEIPGWGTPAAVQQATKGMPGRDPIADRLADIPWLGGDAARTVAGMALLALAESGHVVVEMCACGQAIGTCYSCGGPRCWHCDPGLGKHLTPMTCNSRHAPDVRAHRAGETGEDGEHGQQ